MRMNTEQRKRARRIVALHQVEHRMEMYQQCLNTNKTYDGQLVPPEIRDEWRDAMENKLVQAMNEHDTLNKRI